MPDQNSTEDENYKRYVLKKSLEVLKNKNGLSYRISFLTYSTLP